VKGIMSEGFYRQEKLTLRDLAVALGLPEYKVRKVINKELGYRNFNEFINEYRINEAALRLLAEPDTPISNIALDVGYRTLSSFNRAFRKEKETTPTAYRE
jgi:AraC-like DNA-binding protein